MIDVIIPVFKGLAATRRCLESVLGHAQRTPLEVVVVDDATPESAIAAWLDRLAADGRITLVRNATNLGFVRSVNLGMAMHAERDVVLLNSDTEVAGDWLDRLSRAAERAPDIGTVTPFSNNATICSYPFQGWSAGVPGTLGLRGLDEIFARANAGRVVDLPTAVGFCIYIRRACLERIGPFAAERFGRGYGEENDFSLRAASAGWRSVLAGDVFIFHEGAVSFGADRDALAAAAEERLLEVHPDYLHKVRAFISADPAQVLRAAVDDARLACGTEEARCVLAERNGERVARLAEAEAQLRMHVARAAELADALAHAETVVADYVSAIANLNAAIDRCQQSLAEHEEVIGRLRSGLAHAESLALARAAELERIHGFHLWKYYNYLLRHSRGERGNG